MDFSRQAHYPAVRAEGLLGRGLGSILTMGATGGSVGENPEPKALELVVFVGVMPRLRLANGNERTVWAACASLTAAVLARADLLLMMTAARLGLKGVCSVSAARDFVADRGRFEVTAAFLATASGVGVARPSSARLKLLGGLSRTTSPKSDRGDGAHVDPPSPEEEFGTDIPTRVGRQTSGICSRSVQDV